MKIATLTAALALAAATSLATAQTAFTQYASPDGAFTVLFPGTPTIHPPQAMKTNSGISFTMARYTVAEGNTAAYVMMTIDYDPNSQVSIDWPTRAAQANTCGGTASLRNTDTYQGHPAALIQVNCPASADLPPTVVLDQAVFNGHRLYELIYVAPTVDANRSSTFLSSLHIN